MIYFLCALCCVKSKRRLLGPILLRFTELGFWRIAKGNGVPVGLNLYDIEYSTFSLVLSSSRRELGVNGDYIYIYIYI